MRKPKWFWALLFIGTSTAFLGARAAQIEYTTSFLGGTSWKYDYVVTNNGLAPIDEFTIFFDRNSFASLSVLGSPANWDSLVEQRDLSIPADGFFDSLVLGPGLAGGASVSGFSVSFSFLGQGSPGSQNFDIVDPETFAALTSGLTVNAAAPVPEPTSTALMLAGLGVVAWLARVRRHPALAR